MNPEALREVHALVVSGHPCDQVTFGAMVTVICTNEMSAARWKARTPNGVLPESRVPVQVVCVEMGGAA